MRVQPHRRFVKQKDAQIPGRIAELPLVGRISFEAQNLLNEIQLTTLDGNPDLPYGAYAPGRTFVVGLSGNF